MTDYVTEGFARRISQGEIINNPCLYEEVQWVTGDGYQEVGPYLVEGGSYSDYVVQTYAPPYWSDTIDLDFLSIDDVGSDQGVRQNCLSHVNVPAFDFGEDALELRETIRFLKNPLRSLNSLVRTFQKKAITKGAYSYSTGVERAKALADVWASYSFAARPLIQSIQEAVDAYTAKLVLPPRMTSRSSDSFSESGFEYQFLTGGSDEEVGVNVNIDVQRDFKVGILYTADTTDDLAYRLGFRLRDWPSTLWEVLPLSFMVDRVVNIKNTINGVVNLLDPNVKILTAWVVNKSERKVSYQVVHYAHSQYTSSFYGDPCALGNLGINVKCGPQESTI
jgi:hypothetical protein